MVRCIHYTIIPLQFLNSTQEQTPFNRNARANAVLACAGKNVMQLVVCGDRREGREKEGREGSECNSGAIAWFVKSLNPSLKQARLPLCAWATCLAVCSIKTTLAYCVSVACVCVSPV